MAAAKRKPADVESVEAKLLDGSYDRMLDAFQAQIDEAAATLRRVYEAMRAENTLRS
jgi:hypothetical protein